MLTPFLICMKKDFRGKTHVKVLPKSCISNIFIQISCIICNGKTYNSSSWIQLRFFWVWILNFCIHQCISLGFLGEKLYTYIPNMPTKTRLGVVNQKGIIGYSFADIYTQELFILSDSMIISISHPNVMFLSDLVQFCHQ